ncbi:MAG: hypothetical protein CSA62_06985 [Planctomycetota bacterium]|nr:MAG: hypothetical protein CSA62_06985 [Planctomycetota bacterium]
MSKPNADSLPVTEERRALAEKRLQYRFKEQRLLSQALCHASARNQGYASNERLEFLGDAVLSLLASWFLYEGLPEVDEGELSRRRAALCSGEALSAVAARLQLGPLLLTGKGQDLSATPNMAGDQLEALIGAIFLDGGLEAAQDFVIREVLTKSDAAAPQKKPTEAEAPAARSDKESPQASGSESKQDANDSFEDSKSKLQHHSLRLRLGLPEYRVVSSVGPGHNLTFTMEVRVQGNAIGRGEGSSKKLASQAAAREALEVLLASEKDTKKVDEARMSAEKKKRAKKASKKKNAN